MARTPHKERWYKAMKKRLGVQTNAEVRAFMKQSGAKAKRTGKGGFNDPEVAKRAGELGRLKRYGKSK